MEAFHRKRSEDSGIDSRQGEMRKHAPGCMGADRAKWIYDRAIAVRRPWRNLKIWQRKLRHHVDKCVHSRMERIQSVVK
jgi:hypothetical protein